MLGKCTGEHSEDTMNQKLAFTVEEAAIATDSLASESAVPDNLRKHGTNAQSKKGSSSKKTITNKKTAAVAVVKFPRCDAAVGKREGCEWTLADAILAECSEPGKDGVKNESYAKMEMMLEEIAKNHGVYLSFERIRKLRKVASAFLPGRRRPGISVEGHLEAGTPEALDAFINSASKGAALTRAYIRRLKYPDEKTEQDNQTDERCHQREDQRAALQNVCRQLERENEQLRLRYTDVGRTNGKQPEPVSPPLSPEDEPSLTVAEDLEQGLRGLLLSRGFDPAVLKQAIANFMKAVLAQGQ
jgi:hypothetical protein